MEVLRKHFLANLTRGVLLRNEDLEKYASQRRLDVPAERIRSLRRLWKFTAMFERNKKRSSFMSSTHFRYGVCQMDLAFVKDKSLLPRRNRGYRGFLVCVEISTLQVAAEPIKNRSYKELMRAITKVARNSVISSITTLLTDRETTFKSDRFVRQVKLRLGIKMAFLKRRHKAYYAELFNSIIKKQLGAALSYENQRREKKKRRGPAPDWIKYLPGIVAGLNNRNVPGTDMKRKSVNRNNFLEMLCKKNGSRDPYAEMNSYTVPSASIRSEDWRRQIFKHQLGDLVLVERRALYSAGPAGRFPKYALRGSRPKRPYFIVGAALKKGGPFTLAPVYRIRASGSNRPLSGWFYQSELVPLRRKRGRN